jgi:hypothetical protein
MEWTTPYYLEVQGSILWKSDKVTSIFFLFPTHLYENYLMFNIGHMHNIHFIYIHPIHPSPTYKNI